jgi:hypothetical protein
MTMTSITVVKINCICREKPMHHFGEHGTFMTFKEEMKMVFHKTITMNAILKHFRISGEIVKKCPLISTVMEGDIAGVGTGDHMIKGKRQINAFRSRHGEYVRKRCGNVKK